MSQRFFVDQNGNYLGSYDGPYDEMPQNLLDGIEVALAPEDSRQIWNFSTEEYGPLLPEPKSPRTIALSKLSITDGLVEGFTVDSYLSGGFQIDTGKFWMFFASPQPDKNYIVNVFDGGLFRCYVQPEDFNEDSFIVTTTDLAGTPADPLCLSIVIMRAE